MQAGEPEVGEVVACGVSDCKGGRLSGRLIACIRHRRKEKPTRHSSSYDEEALDVAQEAFARAYASLPTFKGESSFTTWLHRIVVNLGIDSLRRTQRSGTVAYDDTRATPEEGEGDLPAVDDPAAALEMKQVRDLLARGIARLPAAQRAVLLLRDVEGLSYEKIFRYSFPQPSREDSIALRFASSRRAGRRC